MRTARQAATSDLAHVANVTVDSTIETKQACGMALLKLIRKFHDRFSPEATEILGRVMGQVYTALVDPTSQGINDWCMGTKLQHQTFTEIRSIVALKEADSRRHATAGMYLHPTRDR